MADGAAVGAVVAGLGFVCLQVPRCLVVIGVWLECGWSVGAYRISMGSKCSRISRECFVVCVVLRACECSVRARVHVSLTTVKEKSLLRSSKMLFIACPTPFISSSSYLTQIE